MKHLYLLLAAVIATLPAFAQHATAPALASQRRFSAPAEQERPDEMARLMAGAGSSTAAARPTETAPSTARPTSPVSSERADEIKRLMSGRAAPTSVARPQEMRRLMGHVDEAELRSHEHYRTKDGHEIHSPARSTHDQVPAGANAKCRDGTYSFSQHRRGACSHHGGVLNWI
jgi:hypothetical protein